MMSRSNGHTVGRAVGGKVGEGGAGRRLGRRGVKPPEEEDKVLWYVLGLGAIFTLGAIFLAATL